MSRIIKLTRYREKGSPGETLESVILNTGLGMEGDFHAQGGDRQLSLLCFETRQWMDSQTEKGLCFSRYKENILLEELAPQELVPGTQLKTGEVILEISSAGKECFKECPLFKSGKNCLLAKQSLFAKVICGGLVKTGDNIVVVAGKQGRLLDSYGRVIDYLRLSVTDRCNLRCLYCMPSSGVAWISHDEVLRFEELLRLCRILAELGINSIRVSGGEPLVRRGVVDLIRELKAIEGIEQLSMTSNGVMLGEHIDALFAAGLEAVNISLDTIDEEKYRLLTRSEGFANVLSAIDRSLELGLKVKINCVPMRGYNDEDIVKLVSLIKNKNINLRFIELMPLGAAASFQPISSAEVISLIEKAYGTMMPIAMKLGNGPAIYYSLQGFTGFVGLISAMSNCFCSGCNRLRLSASGVLKPCLSSNLSLDLRSLIRGNASDDEIKKSIRELAAKKPERHSFGVDIEKKEMFRIGG